MRAVARVFLSGLLLSVLLAAVLLPAAALAVEEVPVVEKLVATNCTVKTCGEETVEGFKEPKAKVEPAEAEAEGFTEAGGRVPFGITDFKVLTVPGGEYSKGTKVPTLRVTHIRTDVAPGLATNPFAVERCSQAEFGKELVPGSHFFTAPGVECNKSEIGENNATVYAGNPGEGGAGDLPLSGIVYDLIAGENEKMANGAKLSSLYGVALGLPKPLTGALLGKGFKEAEAKGAEPGVGGFPTVEQQEGLEAVQYYAHTLIKGNVEWGKEARGTNEGDFHDYFEIEVSPELPLIRSRLTFEGTIGNGDFITNATSCPGHNTTSLKITDLEGKEAPDKTFTTPIGLEKCESLKFEPSFALTPETTASDRPDAFTAAASEPHEPNKPDQSQVKSASFTLPEGMTLNPSAAHGLEACTPKQAHQEGTVFGPQFGVECPAGSKIGTVSLNVPTLPNGSLTGSVYLAGPETGPITGPPYMVYVVANSEQYGLSVRLIGEVQPNEVTGRATTFFRTPPEQPFSNLAIHFERGALAPIANPLVCGPVKTETSFSPFTGTLAQSPFSEFTVDSNGSGGTCSPPVLALSQSTADSNSNAGAYTSFAFNLARGDGQQYLTQVKAVLPEGLLGAIPSLTLCGEAEANGNACPATSKIGTATVLAGAGSEPYSFSGPVYMTGPFNGAPYGMEIVVPANAGPFELGNVVTRASVGVDPHTTRLVVTATVPTIWKGIPLRLKGLSMEVNRPNFLFNPTNCGVLATESALTGTPTLPALAGATQGLSTPFQVGNCSALAFKPSFTASTNEKTARKTGASLNVNIGYSTGQANVKYVKVQLPKQLPSRLTTLRLACTEATFNANPAACPPGSMVGTATVSTPVLPDKMTGPAILVSHGGQAFPDMEMILSGDNVTVVLDGQTNIHNGITTSTFAAVPDAPITSFALTLPSGPTSLLAANGNLCLKPLVMPTTLEGQNGVTVTQNTKISVSGCGVFITA
ncbi:MAG TPA: hypothetical protein VID48_07195, partial [Solirubrobacteraceae bacterium]